MIGSLRRGYDPSDSAGDHDRRGQHYGARSAVTNDVALSSMVAGMPANFLRWRQGYVEEEDHGNKE